MGFFEKLKQGLSKTASSISSVFTASELDDDFYDDLEESLIVSDLGMDTTETVMDRLRQTVREQHIKTVDEAKIALRAILADMLNVGDSGLRLDTKPSVILVIGVNGVGKTTTIGKLAHQLRDQGKKVLLCAGDTFRAAAADQLEIWSERAHCDIIRQHEGADPASVVYDAIAAAKARGSDVIICDTAGRLHNKQNLMNELNKISRILDRELPNASKEVLLVLDGIEDAPYKRAHVCSTQRGRTNIGVLPSGKAQDFDSRIRWFESSHPRSRNLDTSTRCGMGKAKFKK